VKIILERNVDTFCVLFQYCVWDYFTFMHFWQSIKIAFCKCKICNIINFFFM
jgi:hypothetical protein